MRTAIQGLLNVVLPMLTSAVEQGTGHVRLFTFLKHATINIWVYLQQSLSAHTLEVQSTVSCASACWRAELRHDNRK